MGKLLALMTMTTTVLNTGLAGTQHVVFSIPQMFCSGCVKRVTQVLEKEKGVSKVNVLLDNKEAQFDCNIAKGCRADKLAKKINNSLGYKVVIRD